MIEFEGVKYLGCIYPTPNGTFRYDVTVQKYNFHFRKTYSNRDELRDILKNLITEHPEILHVCKECGYQFTHFDPRIYCSYHCAKGRGLFGQFEEAIKAKKSRQYVYKNCRYCGKPLKNGRKSPFCGEECRNDFAEAERQAKIKKIEEEKRKKLEASRPPRSKFTPW